MKKFAMFVAGAGALALVALVPGVASAGHGGHGGHGGWHGGGWHGGGLAWRRLGPWLWLGLWPGYRGWRGYGWGGGWYPGFGYYGRGCWTPYGWVPCRWRYGYGWGY